MLQALLDELRPNFTAVTFTATLVRLLAALLLSSLIGVEREYREKTAGLRTHMLIGVAACLFVIVGEELAILDFGGDSKQTDPIRLIEAVTAGVAFLAAGLIFNYKGEARNVTTGASMWLAGAIGLSCGAGHVPLAAVATLVTIVVVWFVGAVERRLSPRKRPARPEE
ncbi:MgtC/SapB family protein [Pseudoroseicyclus tamaricis]|uniref:Protein MgtC n=1 Tax=Pseudoroseicyclus tamaricis TaxID=2705421 RepID=A0A6B2JZ85_9RHOB|nr:MgtC/SapB family protein [Pseudoroseicyclus tamaricis]NDV01949.1 MgtC/SapB family protein [Pseudoroseicyclus tamaricis]